MAVPLNVCVAWPSTVASIPAGWSRETALDSRYILGAAAGADTDLVTDRGNLTHSHTSPAHTPTQNSHTHTFHVDSNHVDSTIVAGGVGSSGPAGNHGHSFDATSSSTTATNNSVTITVDAVSNDLSYQEVIWIKSDGTPLALPSGCIAFFESDSLPSGWSRVNGDTYLKGAGTGANGGATGGSNSHSHTSPAHTHTQNSHTHTGTSTGADSAQPGKGVGANIIASLLHTHAMTFAATTGTNQSVTTTINSGNGEPPFKKLNIVQTGGNSLPSNIIALWLGANAAIPADWSRYSGMDSKWLKGAASNGESGVTTGGSSQHTHTASDCQPIQDAHSHVATSSPSTATTTADGTVANTFAADGHNHTSWDVSSDTPTNNAVSVTIDQCSVDAALPKHRTVIYIQFTGTAPPGRTSGVWTSYHLGLFDTGDPEAQILPEAGKRIAQSDLRFVPR